MCEPTEGTKHVRPSYRTANFIGPEVLFSKKKKERSVMTRPHPARRLVSSWISFELTTGIPFIPILTPPYSAANLFSTSDQIQPATPCAFSKYHDKAVSIILLAHMCQIFGHLCMPNQPSAGGFQERVLTAAEGNSRYFHSTY